MDTQPIDMPVAPTPTDYATMTPEGLRFVTHRRSGEPVYRTWADVVAEARAFDESLDWGELTA